MSKEFINKLKEGFQTGKYGDKVRNERIALLNVQSVTNSRIIVNVAGIPPENIKVDTESRYLHIDAFDGEHHREWTYIMKSGVSVSYTILHGILTIVME